VEVAERLLQEKGIRIKVINLPWLNRVDSEWLRSAIRGCERVVCLDNHYLIGGQADTISRTVSEWTSDRVCVEKIGLSGLPPCGTNLEVLQGVNLNANQIMADIGKYFSS